MNEQQDHEVDNGFYLATFEDELGNQWQLGVNYVEGDCYYQGKLYSYKPIELELLYSFCPLIN